MLLEKVSQLNKNDAPQVSEVWSHCRHAPLSVRQQLPALQFMLFLQDGSAHDAFDTSIKFEDVDVDNVSLLTMSVQGKRYSMTPHEVSQMPLQSFSALWTVSPGNTFHMATHSHDTTGTKRCYQMSQTRHCLAYASTTRPQFVNNSV